MLLTKRFVYYLPLITLLTLSFNTANAQWTEIGGAGFSTSAADYINLVFDSNDTAYIAFKDYGSSQKATVMKYNGSSWATVGSAGFSAGNANNISLAFDSNDTPYVSYRDYGNSSKATVMKYNGSSWVAVGGAGFTAGIALYSSLAFDSNDTPYVAFRDYNQSSKATVMQYNGSGWVTVGSAGFSAGTSDFTKLAFDSNDTPYVAYINYNNNRKPTVKKYNGSSWVTVGSAGFSSGITDYLDFTLDNNDTPYVVYQDYDNSSGATVMKYNGSSWVTVGSTGFNGAAAHYFSLSFDSNNIPHVAFKDYDVSQKLAVMKYNGSSWVDVGTAGFSAGTANHVSLAFNNNDELFVACRDGGNSSKATVQKYVQNTWNGSTWSDGAPDSTFDAYISATAATASFTCRHLYIDSAGTLNTGTNDTVTVHGDMTNNGNGVSGQGTLSFTADGSAEITGDTVGHEGTVVVESGCTLTTNNLLRLTSDTTNTGRIGNSAGTISGNVYVQRYMPGKRSFRFYGHPFSSSIALNQLTDEIDITGDGGASNGFTATQTNNPSAYWFDVTAADTATSGANAGWTAFASANTASWDQYELLRLLVRGAKGEGLTGGSYTPSAATFEGVGAVNQGTQVVTLTKGDSSEFVGCGNPFPSPVEMDKVTVGSNVGANYYAWDATSGASGAYVTNAWTLPYDLPAYAAFFTTVSANSNNTLTFEEADKVATSASLFKTTAADNWVELYIYDSTTKWDRLLINFNTNGMEAEDQLDGKKLYNPNLDFFTLSKDDVRLAVDVRPYQDSSSIPLGLTAYNRYNKYVIKVGMFDVPVGTKLYLYDKHLNKKEEIVPGMEYWFDVTNDSLTQGNDRFEINMVGTPTNSIASVNGNDAAMQLIPNPAHNEVKVAFKQIEGDATLTLTSVTGQIVYTKEVTRATGNVTVPLSNVPSGTYIVELKGENGSFTQKLTKE